MIVYGISYCICRSPYIVPADIPPGEWQFHRFLLWQLIFYSYSESSCVADQTLADLPPTNVSDRFLLWELLFGRPSVGRSIPHLNGNLTDSYSESLYFIPTLRTHICQTRSWQIYLPVRGHLVTIDSSTRLGLVDLSSDILSVGKIYPLGIDCLHFPYVTPLMAPNFTSYTPCRAHI